MLDDKRTWRRRLKAHLRPWRQAAFECAAAIFPVSHYGADLIRSFRLTQKNVHVVPIGVDPQRFKPSRSPSDVNRPKRIITVARLDLHKGHDRSLEALALVKSKALDFEYLIVGKGDEENRLRLMVKKLGLESKVTFAGYVPDKKLPGVYAGADIFLMASREIPGRLDLIEGFGIAFLEASASGLPVIAGRSGGVADAVRDGETGLLVSADDPKDIAEAICLLLTSPQLCRRLGSEGRRWTLGQMNCENTAKRMLNKMQLLTCDKRRILDLAGHVRNLRDH
jgi:phosphatidylinositol alpha-1,6-mannosyltransferase